MRVGDEHMVYPRHFGERKLGDARSRVNQDVVVDEHRGGAQMPTADAATAAKNSDLHDFSTTPDPLLNFTSCQTSSRHPSHRPADGHDNTRCVLHTLDRVCIAD